MQPDTSNSPPAKPIVRTYPTPDLRDRIYVESRDARLAGYELPEKGSPYEGREAPRYEGWVFATAQPSDKVGWTDHFYLNERANQDAYNFSVDYPWVDREYPRYTRTYVFLRTDFKESDLCTKPVAVTGVDGDAVVEPKAHQTDSADCRCVMVNYKIERLQDSVLDSLFIGVTKVFERVPAPIKVVLDRPEGVLPFNHRVNVPAIIETEVQENATDGDAPTIINEEDWHVEESTDSAFRKTVERTKRVLVEDSVLQGQTLTRQQQVGLVTSQWSIGRQVIGARARVIDANILDVGNNTTIKEETLVPRVFPASEFAARIPDTVPPEFRDLLPTRTTAITSEGQAAPPTLGPGELERISEQQTEFIKRDTVVDRDLDQLPKTLTDQLIDGIQTHGSEFGGVFDNARTLARGNQDVEEGFGIIRSSVKHLGSGLTARETERLSTLQGAHLLLTNPGSGFVCDPAVVFSGGDFGTGAAGTAVLSTVPGGAGGPGLDPGGVFSLGFTTPGDDNGVFNFLGARYNGGNWRNPATAGNIDITYSGNDAYPITDTQLAGTVDRQAGPRLIIVARPGGGHYIVYDLGPGRKLAANRVTIRTNPGSQASMHKHIQVQGFNNFVDPPTSLAGPINMPLTADTWSSTALDDTTAFRYFWLFGTDGPLVNTVPPTYPVFGFGEIEFYGTLTIVPAAVLNYIYDGDANGAFFFLGQRGGNGVWRNPHTNADIVAGADGLAGGTLDELVDRQPSNIYTDPTPSGAYYFDLMAGRSLLCNKLSYRQRTGFGSGTTSFDLQGRNDLGDPGAWVSLVTVHPAQTPDTWTTVSVPSTIAYRQFRIISAQGNFTVGEVELYGELALAAPAVVATYSVTQVVITNGGANYITVPTVRFCGGGGSGAAGTAVIAGGVVIGVTITNPGGGYVTPPTVSFFVPGGGSGAVANTTLLAGAVTGATVTLGGTEYGTAPLVQIVGDGSGATAHATVTCDGQVATVVIDTPGTGYTVASVLFKNAGGPTAIAKIGKGVAAVNVSNGGVDYVSPPAVSITGDGINATAAAILGFPIASVVINNRGFGYTSTPGVAFQGDGSGAAGTAIRGFAVASVSYTPNGTLFLTAPPVVVTGGGLYGAGAQFVGVIGRPLLAILVGAQGSGYTSDPSVGITGDGSGATATSVRSFAVASIAVGAGGAAYTSAPTVTISAPTGINGIQATAHAVLTAGAVTSIVLDNPGFGYLSTPTVILNGGGGDGATGTATLATAGAVNSIVIGAAGSNYTVPATIAITGGAGSGATATSTLNTNASGLLLRVDIVDPGSGYTAAPTLSIAGGTTPTATLSTSGQIVAVNITNAGSLYSIPPIVGFTGGGGSGAAGSGLLGSLGKVKSVTVTNPGEGFTAIPSVTFLGGGATATAVATASLQSTGKIKSLILIDPGPDYTVAPLVSFFGCSGTGATALYILGTGWPILTDIVTDPVEGIVVNIVKKIVPAGTERPATGYVDIYALDKYRSIQITSSIDLSSIPPPELFCQTHTMNLPPLLVSVGAAYSNDTSKAIRINEGFGSASVKASVRGKIFVAVQDGYKGPAKANVIRTFMFGPPTAAQTPEPLIITPATGTCWLTTRNRSASNSGGTTGGFSYVEISQDASESNDTLDISGVLTGAFGLSSVSPALIVTADDIMAQGIAMAQARGINDTANISLAVAYARVSAQATMFLAMPASCPRFLAPGTTFLLSAGVEKWRFGLYVQTLIYVTIPEPCPIGDPGYET